MRPRVQIPVQQKNKKTKNQQHQQKQHSNTLDDFWYHIKNSNIMREEEGNGNITNWFKVLCTHA
jgi:hypothetical protein